MNAKLSGLFSGFPAHHFTDEIALVLRENLPRRESLVFISAWPKDYARNDDDSDGMHEMFAERGMAFAEHRVIGLTDFTIKGHYVEDAWFIPTLKEFSMTRPVFAMEDESAIFIRDGAIWSLGNIHWIDKGRITTLTDEIIREQRINDLAQQNHNTHG